MMQKFCKNIVTSFLFRLQYWEHAECSFWTDCVESWLTFLSAWLVIKPLRAHVLVKKCLVASKYCVVRLRRGMIIRKHDKVSKHRRERSGVFPLSWWASWILSQYFTHVSPCWLNGQTSPFPARNWALMHAWSLLSGCWRMWDLPEMEPDKGRGLSFGMPRVPSVSLG